MHAKELVRHYEWMAFYRLSVALNPTESLALFENCFGKLSSDAFDAIRYARPIEHRLAAIYAQANQAPPEASRRKHSSTSTPSLTTYASTSASPPIPVNVSSTCLTIGLNATSSLLSFFDSVAAMADEAAFWRTVLYADEDAIKRLDTCLREELFSVLQASKNLSWLASKLKQ